jgi:citrate/tricarballylate utilization protein
MPVRKRLGLQLERRQLRYFVRVFEVGSFSQATASLGVATLYHCLIGWRAHCGFMSPPKLLGIPGDIAPARGSAGLPLPSE